MIGHSFFGRVSGTLIGGASGAIIGASAGMLWLTQD